MFIDPSDFAVKCGLTRRFGPAADEVALMPPWRRALAFCLPKGQRWRLSYLAPAIKTFERTAGRPS